MASRSREPNYVFARGTSFAAPLVSGTAALMLARDPLLTSGRVLDIITGTTRPFPKGSACRVPYLCGSGMLDAGAAVGSTLLGGPPPPNATQVVEYYRADLDHYFMTAILCGNLRRQWCERYLPADRLYFYAYPDSERATHRAARLPVLRERGRHRSTTHFYSASFRGSYVLMTYGSSDFETANAFTSRHALATARRRRCRFTVLDNRRDANLVTRWTCRCGGRCSIAGGARRALDRTARSVRP
jgi:hypothetical protein